ncbi:MAG: hypothetical protein V7724_18390 [Sediminicola sp.]
MLPQVYAKYYGKTYKLDHVILQEVGYGQILFVYLKDGNGNLEVVPFKDITFVHVR